MKSHLISEYSIERDYSKCTDCGICIGQCSYNVHYRDVKENKILSRDEHCVNCLRCVVFCPVKAISVRNNPNAYKSNFHWTHDTIIDIKKRAESGCVILSGMGTDKPYLTYWDNILLNACQVTNPPIDPIREPIEIRTYLGRKPQSMEYEYDGGETCLASGFYPQLCLETPILFAAMSHGAVNLNVQETLARAAMECGTLFNCGEGGLHPKLHRYGKHAVVQVASGRFGLDLNYLNIGSAIEIKIGQGAKPGIGGHLPGEKVTEDVATVRMIPAGTDAISPAPHHDIYSIEDLNQLICALREATDYTKPIAVKIAAVHNSAAIACGIARAGADIIVLDGVRGSTGAAPKVIRDNVGIPVELALAASDERLREEGIRDEVSIIAAGGIRSSGDILKAIALGADAVYIGTAALVAMGCTLCQKCNTGKCPWGIATTRPELVVRLNPEEASQRLVNLINAWNAEIKELLGAMGMDSIESLRGNREQLRGVGLQDHELKILGIRAAGN